MPTARSVKFYSYDVMPNSVVKISSILKHFQQIARENMDDMGLSYEKILEKGVVFVLSRIRLKISKPIMCYDEVEIQTWQRAVKGATFIRDFRIVRDGEIIACASSYWVLIDFKSRKICRPSVLDGEYENIDIGDHIEPERFIEACCAYERAQERIVRYSDTDQNRHLNNTVYADITTDCLGYYDQNEYIKDIQINFEGEAMPGDVIELERTFSDEFNYVKGTIGERKCFEAKLKFEKV